MLSSASGCVLSGRRNFESCCEEEPVAGHGVFCASLSPLVGNLCTFKGSWTGRRESGQGRRPFGSSSSCYLSLVS